MIININWFSCQFCHMSSNRHNYFCLRCWSLWITTLDGSPLWSPYLQFACSVELCESLFWLPVLPMQHPALSTSHGKRFTVGIWPGKFLHWSSFTVTVLVGGRLQGQFPLTRLPWNLPGVPGIFAGHPLTFQAHQSAMSWTSWKGSNFHSEEIAKPPFKAFPLC